MRMVLGMKWQIFVLTVEIPCEWMFATKFAGNCECDGVVHSGPNPIANAMRAETEILGGGGKMGPATSSWPPPGKRSRDRLKICKASLFRLRCVSGCYCSCCLLSLYPVHTLLACNGSDRPSASFRFSYLEGGSLDGGDLVSPRCLGPSRLTSGGCGPARGPRHPANLLLFGFQWSGIVSAYVLLGLWVRYFSVRSEANILY